MTLQHPFILNVLQQVSIDRLQKAINALADASLSITITRQTDTEVRALVKNGEGKSYGVTLSESGTFCSCPDALYRGSSCKHMTIVALFTLRQLNKATQQEHSLSSCWEQSATAWEPPEARQSRLRLWRACVRMVGRRPHRALSENKCSTACCVRRARRCTSQPYDQIK